MFRGLLGFLAALQIFQIATSAWADEAIIEVKELPPADEKPLPPPPGPPPPGMHWVRRSPFHRKLYTSPSLGVTSVHYKEGDTNYSAIALTGKISTRYALSPRWDLGGSMYLTLMPLKQTPSDNTARFLGVNARIGYSPKIIPSPWRLSLLTGLYYTRMFVSNDAFGFTDMVGPQLFPVLARLFSTGDSAMIYLKFSPVTNQLSLLSFSNRELAAGFTFARLMKNGHALTFSLDYANMSLDFTTLKAITNTLTFSVGMNL